MVSDTARHGSVTESRPVSRPTHLQRRDIFLPGLRLIASYLCGIAISFGVPACCFIVLASRAVDSRANLLHAAVAEWTPETVGALYDAGVFQLIDRAVRISWYIAFPVSQLAAGFWAGLLAPHRRRLHSALVCVPAAIVPFGSVLTSGWTLNLIRGLAPVAGLLGNFVAELIFPRFRRVSR